MKQGHSYVQMFAHIVWTTKLREPLIGPEVEQAIYRCIGNEVTKLDCKIIAIGGVADHVHLLVKVASTVSLDKLMNQVKGVSSHFANDNLFIHRNFSWQVGYGGFSISKNHVSKVADYVNNQKSRHASGLLWQALESIQAEGD